MKRYFRFSTRLLLLFAITSGCSSLKAPSMSVSKVMWWKADKADPQVPARLVSTWTDTILNVPGQQSKRGFGGRIMFFTREGKEPVPVDGQLVVYAYDESDGNPSTAEPTRRYIFPAAQFVKHQSESSLGPSYSVWLPWDEVGGSMKNVSLIARFEPRGGPLIVGDQTSHLLPGHQLAESKAPTTLSDDGVQLTNFQESTASIEELRKSLQTIPQGQNRELQTTSIRLPKRLGKDSPAASLAERLRQGK